MRPPVFIPALAFCALLSLSSFVRIGPGEKFFPSVYFTSWYSAWIAREAALPYGVPTEDEEIQQQKNARDATPIILNDDILAFYGKPDSKYMGILGRYTKEELKEKLDALSADYDEANGARGVRTAFYLIYATCQPKGRLGYLDDETVEEYLDFARENGMLVFIDHQIGKHDPVESLKEILPLLRHPHVHLALDPEWRTAKPMREIGSITADELNRAQEAMSEYIAANGIEGERMLVVHQFHPTMLRNRREVRSGYAGVNLIHCADGFGNPALKRLTYKSLGEATNMPFKGFKLFYNFKIPGAGYDEPLLSPEEVFALEPKPSLVMYQ